MTTHSPGGDGDGYDTLTTDQILDLARTIRPFVATERAYEALAALTKVVNDTYLRGQQVERAKHQPPPPSRLCPKGHEVHELLADGLWWCIRCQCNYWSRECIQP